MAGDCTTENAMEEEWDATGTIRTSELMEKGQGDTQSTGGGGWGRGGVCMGVGVSDLNPGWAL